MSGIALVLHSRGYDVTGSDLKPSRYTALLQRAGVDVKIGHKAVNLDHPDVVVISSAIPAHNVELQEARRRGILVVKRAQSLAWLMECRPGRSGLWDSRQDHHYLDDQPLAGRRRLRPDLSRRRRTQRPGVERAPRQGGLRCLRGRRVRRLAPAALRPKWPCSPTWSSTITATTCTRRRGAGLRGLHLACLPQNGLLVYCAEDSQRDGACSPRRAAAPARTASRLRRPIRRARWSPKHRAAASRSGTRARGLAGATLQVPGQAQRSERAGVLRDSHRAGSCRRIRSSRRSPLSPGRCAASSSRASGTA